MKQNYRWIYLAVLGLMVLSACSVLPYSSETEDIREIADKIAVYTLPEGYSEQFAVELAGYQLVSLIGSTPACHIYLLQTPENVSDDLANLQVRARDMQGDKGQEALNDLHVVEERTVTLRGEDVPLLVSEGINSENKAYREVTALFTGLNGPALVSISSPVDRWDWDQVNAFLASIQ